MFSLQQTQRRMRSVEVADSEAGFVLLAVLFLVALILIALAVAAPRIAQSIQRDKELELVHRGEQYKRAIKLYYRKFGAYPSSMDQLVNTNQIRFLRKRYTDPMTGKDDWKIIHFGEAHVKVMGLFGQPISNGGNTATAGSTAVGGVGPGGVGSSIGGTAGSPLGSSTSPTTGSTGSTTSGSTTGSDSQSGSAFGSTDGSSGSTGGTAGTTSGLSAGGLGSGNAGNTNPTLGGGPIVGVKIPQTKASIKEYKQQKHYNEWEFVYDPLEDQLQAGTLFGGAGQNVNGTGTGTNPTSGTGGFSGTGFGSSPGSSNPGTGIGTPSPAPTPTPQQ